MILLPMAESIQALAQEKTSRSLLVRCNKSEIALHISTDLWMTAERVRDDFRLHHSRENETEEWNELEVLLNLISHSLQYAPYHMDDFPVRNFLKQLFLVLHVKFLECQNPHACLKKRLSNMELSEALRIYYDVHAILKKNGDLDGLAPITKPILLEEVEKGRASLLAIFGGQGNTDSLLEELVELEKTYHPIVRPFLEAVTPPLLHAADDLEAKEYLSKGLNVLQWIDRPECRPSQEYLASAAISLPLVGLIQLANFHVMCSLLGSVPVDFVKQFSGTTGHSQGIISAAVISLSKTYDDFIANVATALQLLFSIGFRAMQAFPRTTLDPRITIDCQNNGEGVPSPMLAITNLPYKVLESKVNAANELLPQQEKITISLQNGPRAFVCSGPPKSLYGLCLVLRKLKATPGKDQSKVPFSERKLTFSIKFLPISSPFHCSLLNSALDRIMDDVQLKRLLLKGQKFQIPVIATDLGKSFVLK